MTTNRIPNPEKQQSFLQESISHNVIPHGLTLTPRQVTKILGENRMVIAEKYGITTRQHVYKILRGKSNHPKLLIDLYSELERMITIRLRMGIPLT
jgi:hypothetical protein